MARRHLVQDAIDNADVLTTANEFVVAAFVMPLIDAGILTPSPHIAEFERRLAQEAVNVLKTSPAKPKRWWRFWD